MSNNTDGNKQVIFFHGTVVIMIVSYEPLISSHVQMQHATCRM